MNQGGRSDVFKSARYSDGSDADDSGGFGKEKYTPSYGDSGQASRASTTTGGIRFTDRASRQQEANPELTRALLNETTRRYDRRTMNILDKTLEKYRPERRFTYFSDRTDILQGDSLFNLSSTETLDSLKSEPFFWIDVNGFSEGDLSLIAENFGVHPLTIEDIQMQDSREKCEVFEHYIFICIRTLDTFPDASVHKAADGFVPHTADPVNVYMIIFEHSIITVHKDPILNIRSVLRRVYPLRNLFDLSADWIGYALIDDIVDEFMPRLRRIEFEVDSIDDLVLVLSQSDQAEMLRRIGRARKVVTHLMRLLKPKPDVLKSLAKRCPDRLKPHTLLYLRDIQDHLFTMVQNLDHYSETLNRSHSNYLAQISIELNAASNRMDSVVKKLTGAAFFMLPLSLISSIWGMNVAVPGDGKFMEDYNFLPFFAIVTGMCALVLFMYFLARKYDWL